MRRIAVICYQSILCNCRLLSLKLLSFCKMIPLWIIPLHVIVFFSVLQGLALSYIFLVSKQILLSTVHVCSCFVYSCQTLIERIICLVGVIGLSQLCLVNDMFLFSNCIINRICKLSYFFLLLRNLSVAKGSHNWHYELFLFDGISIPSFLSIKMWSSALCGFNLLE